MGPHRRKWGILVALAVLSLPALGQAVFADSIIHESATLGWTGVWGGWTLDSSQFTGSRFHVDHHVEVTKIGGHISGTGDFFGAIISLSSWGSLPQGSPFTDSEVVASVVFTPHSPSTDYRTALSVVLEPGDYALVFGSGQLGASGGNGFMANLMQNNLPGSSYFFWDGSSWHNTNPNPPPRLVVEGITEATISGFVRTAGGAAAEDVLVSADNGGGPDMTDANGYYELTVPYNWSGTVTPTKTGWDFDPPSRPYSNVTEGLRDQDYTGFPPVMISGHILDDEGAGVEGITVSADSGGGSDSSDANGFYEITLPYDWSGTVTPAKTGWGFTPESRTYSNVTLDQTGQDYTAFPPPKISGRITGMPYTGVEGVSVSADNGGTSCITGPDGYYEVTVPYGWSGTVTLVKEEADFWQQRSYSNVTDDISGVNYMILVQIYGRVVDEQGWGLFGVMISGDNYGGTTQTRNGGRYIANVPYGWSGNITPTMPGWGFMPASRSYSNVVIDILGQDYTAFKPKISGYLHDVYGSAIKGVSVSADNGGGSDTTDINGYYSLTVRYSWSGTVTVSKAGWTFDPNQISYENVISHLPDQNYTGIQPVISGYLTDSDGIGVDGVIVATDDGNDSDSTDANGFYELIVPHGWSGKVEPNKPGWAFDPNARVYTNVTEDQNEQNYTAFAPPVISGYVRNPNQAPVFGVLVSTDDGTDSNTTDANGYYQLRVPQGWSGQVTPSKAGSVFDPDKRLYENLTTDEPNQHYTSFVLPIFSVHPNDFDFVAATDNPYPPDQILYIGNEGHITLRWEVTKPNDCNWLTVLPMTGECTSETNEVVLSVDATGLHPGPYSCDLTLSDPNAQNSPQTVRVDLRVDGPVISVSPNDVLFRVYIDGPNSAEQMLYISNTGVDVLHWQITIPTGCEWLNVYPLSGESSGEVDEVLLSVDANGLNHGSYSCILTISDSNAENSPQTVQINLLAFISEGQIYVPVEFPTIQEAIDAAIDGDEVIVDRGTYTGPGNVEIDFRGKAITVRSIDPNDMATVDATVVDCNYDQVGFGFVFENGEGPNSVLDGLTITGARWGGGVYLRGSSPTIRNCIIRDNRGNGVLGSVNGPAVITDCIISNNSGGEWGGGGISLGGTGNITIRNCIVSDNHSYWWVGGGISCHGYDQEGPPVIMNISDCIITGNWGAEIGGGVSCCHGSVSNCIISNNMADNGGGLFLYGGTITNCTVSDNSAIYDGGGIYQDESNSVTITDSAVSGNRSGRNGGGICCYNSNLTVTNCSVTGNAAEESGGGICCEQNSPTITNCTISNNRAGHSGGGIFGSRTGSPTVMNCVFSGNRASNGGAVADCSGPIANNCTIVGNYADHGSAISSGRGPVINCIVWANRPADWVLARVLADYSCVQGGYPGSGNIDCDPCFAVPGYWHPNSTPNDANDDFWVDGDYHLKSEVGRWQPSIYSKVDPAGDRFIALTGFAALAKDWQQEGGFLAGDLDYSGFVDFNDLAILLDNYLAGYDAGEWVTDEATSLCIDAGDPNSDWTGELWPHGKRINMGAYGGTHQASMSLSSIGNVADLNGDDVVNFGDFAHFADSWEIEQVLLAEDFDRNGTVNPNDLDILGDNWLWEE